MYIIKFIILCCVVGSAVLQNSKPNIIVIIADDMGWNDVSFHGSNEIPTPNIDALAYNGVILNSHYTQALCTPSRSAFLTGKYPIHLGMQHLVILEPEPWGLPLNETLLPQHLKRNGYKTHAIGKWHLGFSKKEYTPTYRGFDSHFGYWQGLQDYYDHTVHSTFTPEHGYDMRRNMTVDWDAQGKYSTTLFTQEAVKTIKEHNTDDPLFMYFAHLAPHTGNDNDPLQAPDEEIAKFAHIEDPERRIFAAMMTMMDRSVGEVVAALREKHMLENTIILFMSDNGGATVGVHSNTGSNYPLRSMKNSPFEGAMRCAAAIWSPLIKKPQRVFNNMMHISDWLPTFYSAIGLNRSDLGQIDGIDMWKAISEDVEAPRNEVLYNIDDVWKYGAIRQGDWKYLYGSVSKKDSWYGSIGNDSHYHYNIEDVLQSKAATALAGIITYQQIREKHQKSNFTVRIVDEQKIKNLRKQAQVVCNKIADFDDPSHKCIPSESPCLFNLRDDPCERINLIKSHPLIAANLETAIINMRQTALPIINIPRDPNADPALYNNTWVNWQDYSDVLKEKMPYNELPPVAVGFIVVACVVFFIVIVVLFALAAKKGPKAKINDVFTDIEDPADHPTTELTMKETELSPIPYRQSTKTRE